MKATFGRVAAWIDDRTGLYSAARGFFEEQIPASSGWRQVLGSVALFLFLTQAFTGVLLAFNYAPTPGEAYNSLRYILTEVTCGRLIRGLHHWGASLLIVVVVLHMVQVFLWGAYKKPRESTWMIGVVLLLVTLAYGLTGYLLPWDNRAYWGTVVATNIAAHLPLVGPLMARLLGGEGAVGVVTFARFYGLHVLLLPPATMLLIGLHVFLVRKHGVAPLPGDEDAPKKPFFPVQVFKDTVAIFAAFAVLFVLAAAARVPLEQLADPGDTSYIPRPEWYFLFLFQTLKLFEGPLEVLGTAVLPGLAVVTLILVPFIYRGKMVKVTRRTVAFSVVALAAIGWTGLTAAAVMTTPKAAGIAQVDYSAPTAWIQLSPEELAGVAYFRQENCASCHAFGRASEGPDLSRGLIHRDAAWLIRHFKDPAGVRPGSSMPATGLNDAQLNSLAVFLLKLNPDNATALVDAPEFATQGALVYQSHQCSACHRVNGVGMAVGPALNGLSRRQTRSWVAEHFANPQKLSPGTPMPPYKFSPRDLDNLMAYLFSLPES
ncbi:MAG: cytochrome b N-terminal domain-containing protein [Bryobacteraceae bacterium]